jgi:hypothetical protein
MARTIAEIEQQLINAYVSAVYAATGVTVDPTQWSDYDYKQLLMYCASVGMATFEQNLDAFTADIETLIASAAPQTPSWFQAQMFKFQYSLTDPQIIQFDTTTFAPYYPTINTNYQIVKYCSVTSGSLGSVLIKCAADSGGTPTPLNSLQKAAVLSYINTLAAPGIYYIIKSLDADKLMVGAEIFYRGEYSSVIETNVKNAIIAYLASIPFNGTVTLSKLVDAIQAVNGVNDIILNDVAARADTTSYADRTILVGSNTEYYRKWDTVAGYIIPETTTGHTLTDTLIFTPQ